MRRLLHLIPKDRENSNEKQPGAKLRNPSTNPRKKKKGENSRKDVLFVKPLVFPSVSRYRSSGHLPSSFGAAMCGALDIFGKSAVLFWVVENVLFFHVFSMKIYIYMICSCLFVDGFFHCLWVSFIACNLFLCKFIGFRLIFSIKQAFF